MKSNSFLKDSIWVGLSNLLISLKGIIVIPIIIKFIGVNTYGVYVLVFTSVMFIFQISSFGVFYRYRRFAPSDLSKAGSLFYEQFIPHFISILFFSSIIFINFKFVSNSILKSSLDISPILFIFFIILYFLFNQTNNFFRLTDRVKIYSIFQVVYPYLNIVLILLFIFVEKRTINYILIAQNLSLFFIILFLLRKLISEIGVHYRFSVDKILFNIKKGFPLVLHYLIDFFLSSSDRYVIAFFLGATAVGVYNPAYSLGALIIFIPKIFGAVLQPHLSREKDNNNNTEFIKARNSIKIFLLIGIPFVVGAFFLSKSILSLLANSQIAEQSYLITPIVSFGILFYGINTILGTILFIEGKTIKIFYFNALAAILNIVLNIAGIYFFRSILVAAISTLFSYFISFLFFYFNTKKYFRFRLSLKYILSIVFSSLIMGIAIFGSNYFLVLSNIESILVLTFIGVIVYGLSVTFFIPKEEKQIVKHFMERLTVKFI